MLSPACSVCFHVFPPQWARSLRGWVAVALPSVSLPFFHAISTMNPPRARSPFTEPFDHAAGQGGQEDCLAPFGVVVALQQHLRYTRCDAEVAIDLEEWGCVY